MLVSFARPPASASASKVMLYDKVCVVTGGNRGIGREIALALACRGATVVLACRDKYKGASAAAAIREISHNHLVHVHPTDMSCSSSVADLARCLEGLYGRVDIVINNAVVAPAKRQTVVTARGVEVEAQWAVNVLGYHFVIKYLQHLLKAPGMGGGGGRVLNLASEFAGNLNMDDVEFSCRRYSATSAYMQAKQADRMLTWAWAQRLHSTGVQVNAIHPGAVMGTGLASDLSLKGGTHTIEQAADAVVAAAAGDAEVYNTSAAFFINGVATKCKYSENLEACQLLLDTLESKYA
jgi:NAD(P)-dependent dehydrogenase (short-subunit alcohol dehydrogenase family)